MKKRLAIVLAAAMLAVAGSQLVFADEGKESVPRPKVEAGESAVPEDEQGFLHRTGSRLRKAQIF